MSFVTSFQFTFKIISQDFIQAFSAGVDGIGFTILGFQGAAISTYAQIHSNSQAKLSSKLLFSNGGKNTVCSSWLHLASHSMAEYIKSSLFKFLLL
ncbi:MAG: hypothetical protein LBQ59_05790 [Candidatus Peribacteria bacterium]|nr:hypothetical protein [Candidatus Peribacteria bacterium]